MWWKQSEIVIIVGAVVLALMVGYDKWKRKREMAEKTFEEKIKLVRKLRDAQFETKGTSDYQEGYFNGLELACSILENREFEDDKELRKE